MTSAEGSHLMAKNVFWNDHLLTKCHVSGLVSGQGCGWGPGSRPGLWFVKLSDSRYSHYRKRMPHDRECVVGVNHAVCCTCIVLQVEIL